MSIIDITHLDIVFGKKQQLALSMMDQDKSRHEIKEKTGCILGVRDVTLSINQGEIFVLMGLSGSGKSTLLKAINGLAPITRGEISLHVGTDLSYQLSLRDNATLRDVRKNHIAMVFQTPSLLPWRTVKENVAFGLEIAGASPVIMEQKIKTTLQLVGLCNWANQYPREYLVVCTKEWAWREPLPLMPQFS